MQANQGVDFVYHSGMHAEHVRPMFGRAWMPLLASLSAMFETATEADIETVKQCLEGFSLAIRVACDHHMETEREAFVLALSKFTLLSHISDMQPTNIAAIHTLLAMAYQNRNGLAESWTHVLACVSRLVRLRQRAAAARGLQPLTRVPAEGRPRAMAPACAGAPPTHWPGRVGGRRQRARAHEPRRGRRHPPGQV